MTVLIVGLREKEIVRLKHTKDIKIIPSNGIKNSAFKDLKKYSHIISLTKFSSHLTEYLCNKHPNYIRLKPTQGISTLNSILDNIYET